MRTRAAAILLLSAVFGLTASTAGAQYSVKGPSDVATGENYHVEIGGFLWDPNPQIVISSESLGIVGSKIDFVSDLGIEKTWFKQLRIVLRPAKKHKFRFEYTPIEYTAQRQISAVPFALLGASCEISGELLYLYVGSGVKGGDEWSIAMRTSYGRKGVVVKDYFDPMLASLNIYAPLIR